MKVCSSNCLLEFAESWGGLWVGNPNPIDDRLLNFAIDQKQNISPRILTFSATELLVWEITGPRIYFADWSGRIKQQIGSADSFSKFAEEHSDFPLPKDFKEKSHKWSLVPATLIRRISRSELFAPIDSLSVYRYLNSGTFRPIHRIGAGSDSARPNLARLRRTKEGPLFKGFKAETGFGAYVREYLNCLIDGDKRAHGAISKLLKDVEGVYSEVINPAQMETIAALWGIDLGILPDVMSGKGLDVVDIRFSWVNRFDRKATSNKVINSLESAGVNLSTELEDGIRNKHVLAVQAKADANLRGCPGILTLRPGQQPEGVQDIIGLENLLLHQSKSGLLVEWMVAIKRGMIPKAG